MDTEQLDDEQQYYKEKYFKYKLKYIALKKQLGGSKASRANARAAENLAWLATPVTAPIAGIKSLIKYNKKANFNWNNLAQKLNDNDNRIDSTNYALYNIISTNNILDKIKNSGKWDIKDAIDEVLEKEFKYENDPKNTWDYKMSLKNYLVAAIKAV
jgi:hypothetical protein